ncbi:radical SAM family heme chaperone HemW [Lentibacillus halophilus]|uniref:Heme chaperone HemW n=1 Tax=Lentibacillus halophilus TaxID=295065 RepID=A0ABP3J5N9_9BACI
MKAQSVYIHIPFCQQICHYCDFTKFFYDEQSADEYIEALKHEVNTAIDGEKNSVETIFIGGGTPTALTFQQLKSLMQLIDTKFDIAGTVEFSIEANPGDFDGEKAKLLNSYGVNRVSLGVQVFDNAMLEQLGRIHEVKDVYHTVELLKKNHFYNISLDLIYALPNQTLDHFRQTLNEAVAFDLPHYSAYALQIEPKTIFYQRYKKGTLHRPPEEEEVSMYELLKDTMRKNGLNHYEISNFAKHGFESRHNLTYWNNQHYYGFGAGAHGYLSGVRMGNIRPLPQYVQQAKETGKPVLHTEEISKREMIEEEMFLGLRKMEGINKEQFKAKYGFPYDDLYGDVINALTQKGWIEDSGKQLRLTDEGMLFGNEVFAQFLLEEHDLNLVR